MHLDEELLSQIELSPFFQDFTASVREEFCRNKNHVRYYTKGQTIIRQNDMDFSLYVIIRGRVFLTTNENPNLKINSLDKGSIFGEVSFVNPCPRITNVIAETDVTVIKLDGGALENLSVSAQGNIKDKIIRVLIKRLDEINIGLITYSRQGF